MLHFLARRIVVALLVGLTVLSISFALTRLSGDLAISIAGPNATAEDIVQVRKNYGLDRPLPMQFADWVRHAATGDLGESYFYKGSVAGLIGERLPVTLGLGLVGLAIALAVALPLGIVAALHEGAAIDRLASLIALIGQAMPSFWLGLVLMITLGLKLQWLPISGTGSWENYVMPGVALAFTGIPALMRLTRTGMIEALAADYIRTARANGLGGTSVVLKHALRNAAMPVVSIAAVQFGFMLGGSITIEVVFALHGIGYLAWESILKNDFPVVQAVVLLLATIYIGLTLLADMFNAVLDPRLRAA
jgi:ABC-type dipeptide/oligopeptide/nickel transport system permease component